MYIVSLMIIIFQVRVDAPTAADFDLSTLSDDTFARNVTVERVVAVNTGGVVLKGFDHTARHNTISSSLWVRRMEYKLAIL